MLFTAAQLMHLWREEVSLKSPLVGMWMRGIYISSATYEDGKLASVQTKALPRYAGTFKLTNYGRGLMMDCLEELSPGAVWKHDESLEGASEDG